MPPRARRRWTNTLALAAGLGAVGAWTAWLERSLARAPEATGWLLMLLCLGLAAYQLRKKLPGAPLGASRVWLQAHVYAAIGSGGVFLVHAGLLRRGGWPDGWLEGALASLYAATFASGLLGLWITRAIPRQLARTGEQFVFERIPRLRYETRRRARRAALDAVDATGSTTLADFYAERLHGFFGRPRSLAYAARPTSATRKRLFRELGALDRTLTVPEREAVERLFALVRRKDDLDFHEARQGLLKGWLVAHIALTWALVPAAIAHAAVALAFRGGPA